MYGYVNKQNHASCTNARVYSFISVDLPRHAPHKFDAFLQPLFEELEELYIKGLEMFFKAPVPGSSPAQYTSTLHVVRLLATELEELYTEGLELFFKAPVPGSSPAQYTSSLHVVPLLATQT